MSSWTVTRLGDAAHVVHGWPFKSESFATEGEHLPVVVAIGNFNYSGGFRFQDSTVKRYTGDFPAEYILNPNDLLLVMTCQTEGGEILGVPARVPNDGRVYLHNQRIGRLIVDRPDVLNSDFMFQLARSADFNRQLFVTASGSKILHTSPTRIEATTVMLPPLREQEAIAEVLGALDDKIAANTKLAATSAALATAIFTEAVRTSSSEFVLSDITTLLSRGITPKYSEEEDTMMVLNQKCVRGQRVDLDPARRTLLSKVREDKLLQPNDVLVNSTGQGTLGRVARWTNSNQATVDSHITIVRFNASRANPVTAGIGLLGLQDTIVEMGEGSTGQTELSRVELGKLRLKLPALEVQSVLGQRFSSMSEMERVLFEENITLAATRDTLLPQLMSGKLRVKDAETELAKVGV
ncbi:restriction endonuclease subunit S [Arthrobacter cavernae]|uniref:Restriction endonuclease subunit S n=1 Tax=Arthrobacter cavernae TaxID=2817681 RepID=A0A939HF18_9MICC|nr:restriction endonuclease subunit S [Arthrobacter cavernae]MBO1268701.1 restriction endonuclease subunit S [Arthrobacter cavernae]